MKHPRLSTLQDYFENELNGAQSGLVKGHLVHCDRCTSILSQMAKVDIRLRKTEVAPVSEELKEKIFSSAKVLLEARRRKIEHAQNNSQAIEEWKQGLSEIARDAIAELKIPALQLASLSLLIGYLISVNQTELIIVSKPLSEEVVVYTYAEPESPVEGENE